MLVTLVAISTCIDYTATNTYPHIVDTSYQKTASARQKRCGKNSESLGHFFVGLMMEELYKYTQPLQSKGTVIVGNCSAYVHWSRPHKPCLMDGNTDTHLLGQI